MALYYPLDNNASTIVNSGRQPSMDLLSTPRAAWSSNVRLNMTAPALVASGRVGSAVQLSTERLAFSTRRAMYFYETGSVNTLSFDNSNYAPSPSGSLAGWSVSFWFRLTSFNMINVSLSPTPQPQRLSVMNRRPFPTLIPGSRGVAGSSATVYNGWSVSLGRNSGSPDTGPIKLWATISPFLAGQDPSTSQAINSGVLTEVSSTSNVALGTCYHATAVFDLTNNVCYRTMHKSVGFTTYSSFRHLREDPVALSGARRALIRFRIRITAAAMPATSTTSAPAAMPITTETIICFDGERALATAGAGRGGGGGGGGGSGGGGLGLRDKAASKPCCMMRPAKTS